MEPPRPVADLDWDAQRARALGDMALDLWTELLERMDDLPVTPAKPAAEVAAQLSWPIPEAPMAQEEIEQLLRQLIFEDSTLCGHGGFLAYISGAGTVPGAAADLVAAALNPNSGGWNLSPGATELEHHLMRWLGRQFGLPETCGGLMTSGGAASNLTALKAARDARAPGNVRRDGVGGLRLAWYASAEAHATNVEAADLLGLGSEAVRAIPTDGSLAMRTDLLAEAIERDLADGVTPVAVVGSAGTTATGAIDPLPAIADLCLAHRIWFHVDAAYGGAVALVPELRPLLAGTERADSIAFDAHKWLNTPHASACLVVRDPALLLDAFSIEAAYVSEDAAVSGKGMDLGRMGPAWSRPFMALKLWMSLAAHGLDAYRRRIAHDLELARYLYAEVERRAEFEPVGGEPALSITCFRYVPAEAPPGDAREAYLNALNERLMLELRGDGRAFPSNAVIDGRYALRACIIGFRTEVVHLDRLLDAAAAVGARVDRALRAAEPVTPPQR
jgi:aromatic-L-amino-acid decarboxylase